MAAIGSYLILHWRQVCERVKAGQGEQNQGQSLCDAGNEGLLGEGGDGETAWEVSEVGEGFSSSRPVLGATEK